MSLTRIMRAAGLATAILVLSALALAQVGQVEGTVKLNADGAKKPVAGAAVDIYRTDIKGHWGVKTDKNGHFVVLGLPLQGSYIFLASGPGLAPTWLNNVRIAQMPVVEIVAESGNGQTMTLEQVQQAIARQKSGGGGAAAPQANQPSPGDKAKADAAQKEYDTKMQAAKELQANFDTARNHYNSGLELMKTNNFANAMSEFEAAAAVDPSKHAAMKMIVYRSDANLAEAHYQLGVDLFNNKKRDEAKTHFLAAVAAAKKAIALATDDTVENNPSLNADLVVYYNILTKNAMLLVEHFGVVDIIDDTLKAMDKAEELDATNKNKWGVLRADMLRGAGKTEEAIAAYKKVLAADANNFDALYGLGLTLIASTERAQIQEGANTLAEFLTKAPATDKRVPVVQSSLVALKEGLKIEAEKPAAPAKRKRP